MPAVASERRGSFLPSHSRRWLACLALASSMQHHPERWPSRSLFQQLNCSFHRICQMNISLYGVLIFIRMYILMGLDASLRVPMMTMVNIYAAHSPTLYSWM